LELNRGPTGHYFVSEAASDFFGVLRSRLSEAGSYWFSSESKIATSAVINMSASNCSFKAALSGRLAAQLVLLGLIALTGGCAAMAALPLGSMMGSPNAAALDIHNSTETRLQQRNFVVVSTNVVGQCKGFSLLGIVTIVPAKFTTAMSRLYANAHMRPGRSQTFANLILNQDSTYLILFSIPRTAISADVIEFIPTTAPDSQTQPPPGE
jgi:hypothetical protein